jgi:SET domain-containing protein
MQSYETRQKEYAFKGQKHFYFMTLNGNEVIDAGAKGNLGRFINHSCEPNCRTEKWMVNGEICVGIFSMQDLKKVGSPALAILRVSFQ